MGRILVIFGQQRIKAVLGILWQDFRQIDPQAAQSRSAYRYEQAGAWDFSSRKKGWFGRAAALYRTFPLAAQNEQVYFCPWC